MEAPEGHAAGAPVSHGLRFTALGWADDYALAVLVTDPHAVPSPPLPPRPDPQGSRKPRGGDLPGFVSWEFGCGSPWRPDASPGAVGGHGEALVLAGPGTGLVAGGRGPRGEPAGLARPAPTDGSTPNGRSEDCLPPLAEVPRAW